MMAARQQGVDEGKQAFGRRIAKPGFRMFVCQPMWPVRHATALS